MKNWKKLSTFLLALSMSVSLAVGVAACGGDTAETSSPDANSSITDVSGGEHSSDEAESSEGLDSSDDNSSKENDEDAPLITTQAAYEENGYTYPELQIAENFEMYAWNEFELVTDATCKTAGIKQASWTKDESIVHQAHIAPRGHTYNNGICACGAGPVYPDAPSTITYVDVEAANTVNGVLQHKGTEFDRYELSEGYYSFNAPRGGAKWFSFSVSEPGQYALYTIDAPSSVKIIRHDASAQFINPNNFPASVFEDGTVYTNVICETAYWSTSWRATFSIEAKNVTVKFRFVKIDEEPWSPKTVREQYLAQQINGVTASEGPENCKPTTVPYNTEFFYEEASGYYRMGTPDNPGEIIYAAITMVPERMLLDKPFTQIQYDAASNLYLDTGKTTIDGDYLIWDYIPFVTGTIYSSESDEATTYLDNCYQNYVNSDGLYPVNQELYQFLKLYTYKNKPLVWEDSLGDWRSDEYMERAWLAACYYYKNLTQLTQGNRSFRQLERR